MADTPDILKKILHRKVEEITARAAQLPLRELTERMEHAPATRRFADALLARVGCRRGGGDCRGQEGEPEQGAAAA